MSLFSRASAVLALALLAVLAPVAGASAAQLLATDVAADRAAEGSCTTKPLSSASAVSNTLTMPKGGWITARLQGDQSSDWDLAIFDTADGRLVGGSAGFGSDEVAQGIAATGAQLVVQACRRSGSGSARAAKLTVDYTAVSGTPVKVQLAKVSVPTRARLSELQELGLDLTEHGGPGFHTVVLYGAPDAKKLRDAKFTYTLQSEDLVARDQRFRAQDRSFARGTRASALPSGRTTYRQLADYENEMKQLVADNPGLVKPLTLPFKTYEGRDVQGIEITPNVDAADGKPVFLQMGVHSGREWPSGEHAMEWAYELVNGYKSGNARVKSLVENTRTIVIPIVNPDGFNISRTAGSAALPGTSDETVNIATHPYEYRRKNCRLIDDSEAGNCVQPSAGLAEPGVDPNRNYGGFWGGPGADTNPLTQTYRGPGPFSEPETRNIRDVVSKRQVTTLITNHTYSDLVLRPPGIQVQGPTPDDGIYEALGDTMAAENGYLSQRSYQLYDTTGTTEDWSYYATGGLGFTFEIGCNTLDRPGNACDAGNFHPAYENVVAEYEGTSPQADELRDGLGNREAYFKALENTADAAKHSVLEGAAPAGAVLRLKKSFKTKTFPQADGNLIEFDDTLDTKLDVPASGRFQWHVNPSTRPVVAQERGRPKHGEPSAPLTFSGDPSTTTPCPTDQSDPGCWNDHGFTVPDAAGTDNARASIRIQWATPGTDWDMTVFEDSNGDGSSVGESVVVGSSAQGTTDFEETTFGEPTLVPGQKYVARVVNFAAVEPYSGTVTFGGPEPFQAAKTESWTLTCERPDGTVLSSQAVTIGRGQRQAPDLSACASAFGATPISAPGKSTPACATAAGFRSVAVRPNGRKVRFDFSRRESRPVNVDVFQVSVGRRVVAERLVARFTNRSKAFEWDGRSRGGKRVASGYLFVRFTLRQANGVRDVRRKVLRYSGGRFSAQPDFQRRESCSLLRSFKLERAAFGGPTARALVATFRLSEGASVRLQLLRNGSAPRTLVNKSFKKALTYRYRLSAKSLPAGPYHVKITVRKGPATTTSTLAARNL